MFNIALAMHKPVYLARIPPPSKEYFYRHYVRTGTPVVITGLVSNWQALERWNFEYFQSYFSHTEAGVVRLKNGELDLNTERGSKTERLTVGETIQSIMQGKLDNGWVIASPVEAFPPVLQQDYAPPAYCADGQFLRARIFLGPSGTVTSLHQDLFENLYITVKGKKRITLFSPSSPVYRYPPFSKLPNHAQVDPEQPDYEKFPRLKNAQPYIVELAAGETLYIPAFWWHHLRNTEPSVTISFWWSQGWKLWIARAAALYKKMRNI